MARRQQLHDGRVKKFKFGGEGADRTDSQTQAALPPAVQPHAEYAYQQPFFIPDTAMKDKQHLRQHGLSLLVLMLLAVSPLAQAEATTDAQYERGHKVYGKYCARCHGKKADGEGRMVKRLYRKKGTQLPSNFTLDIYADRPAAYLRKIIVDGGEHHSMSKYMPPFGQELSGNNVDDLVYFIRKVPQKRPQTKVR